MAIENYTEQKREIPILDRFDVIVVGGGISGVSAAVAAGRTGAKVALIERNGFLGGIATSGLMTSMTNEAIRSDELLVVGGVFLEVMEKLVERNATSPHWRCRAMPQFPFDQEVFRALLIELVLDAGVEILVETFTVDAIVESQKVRGVVIESKAGRQAVLADAVVDTTGDADIAHFCGAPVRNKPPDSASLLFLMAGADLDQTVAYFEERPEEWSQYQDRVTSLEDFLDNWRKRDMFHIPHGGGWKMKAVQNAISGGQYVKNKGICTGLDAFGMFAYRPMRTVLINTGFYGIDHLDIRRHSQAELEGRRYIALVAAFLNEHMPGFQDAFVVESANTLGVRFTRWLDAGFDVTLEDIAAGCKYEDSIGSIAAYDHHPQGGVVYPVETAEIPLRIMLPQNVENVIVGSGKSVSTAPRAALRLQVACFVLGQAAGAAAALAAERKQTIRELPIKELQRILIGQGAYLGDAERLAELGF